MKEISDELYDKLDKLGLIPNDVRKDNVGRSDYSKHLIQPWSIWIDYNLNPWDADIIKRTLRTKEEPGLFADDARIMDYQKIIHICKERIRQLQLKHKTEVFEEYYIPNNTIQLESHHYLLQGKEITEYNEFREKHRNCKGNIEVCFSNKSAIGQEVKVRCTGCGEEKDITDVSNW